MTLVPQVLPMSYRDAESHSIARLRRHFPRLLSQPGQVNVLDTWELLRDEYDIDNSVTVLPDGVEGRTWPDNRVEISEATYIGAVHDEVRPRFTIVHECNHAWHHASQIRCVLESGSTLHLNRSSSIPPYRNPEWQADALTGAYLMPLPALRILAEKNVLTPCLLQDVFTVSYTAASTRIGIVTRKNFL